MSFVFVYVLNSIWNTWGLLPSVCNTYLSFPLFISSPASFASICSSLKAVCKATGVLGSIITSPAFKSNDYLILFKIRYPIFLKIMFNCFDLWKNAFSVWVNQLKFKFLREILRQINQCWSSSRHKTCMVLFILLLKGVRLLLLL